MKIIRLDKYGVYCYVLVPRSKDENDAFSIAIDTAFKSEYFDPDDTMKIERNEIHGETELEIDTGNCLISHTVREWLAIYEGVGIREPVIICQSDY